MNYKGRIKFLAFILSFLIVCGMITVDNICATTVSTEPGLGLSVRKVSEEDYKIVFFGKNYKLNIANVKESAENMWTDVKINWNRLMNRENNNLLI